MANNEDVFIEKDSKIILMTEVQSAAAQGMADEIITIPELTEINRAMIASVFPNSGNGGNIFPVVMSGGCSGNAVRIAWAASGEATPMNSISGEDADTSGYSLQLIVGGH